MVRPGYSKKSIWRQEVDWLWLAPEGGEAKEGKIPRGEKLTVSQNKTIR